MKIISATFADLEIADLGTKSRLAGEIGGVPILRRTVERIATVNGITKHIVLCPRHQAERVRRVLNGLGVDIVAVDGEPDPWRKLTRAARKWSIDGWRGGLGGTTYFDEFCFPSLLQQLLASHPAETVLVYPAAAPLISPALAERMIEKRAELEDQTRLAFAPAPPGLAGILLDAVLIGELAQAKSPIGSVFSYKPDWPRKDLIFHPACLELPVSLRFASGRLVADTDRSLERIHALLRELGQAASDEAIGEWLIRRDDAHVERFPREIEIELTTDTPYPASLLRPPSPNSRGPLDMRVMERISAEAATMDDTLIVLGGSGDPLRHPQFERVLEALCSVARPYGVAVCTFAADLNENAIQSLIRHDVDVCCVMLDAWTAELYHRLHGPKQGGSSEAVAEPLSLTGRGAGVRVETSQRPSTSWVGQAALDDAVANEKQLHNSVPSLENVLKRLHRLEEARQAAKSTVPIVVPEFCKARENAHEMDAFYDGWLRQTGAASIVGYTAKAGQLPDRSLVNMQPPVRTACRRTRSRCVVLADGRVAACDQDLAGVHALGSLRESSLAEIWQSAGYQRLREMHATGHWADHSLCRNCAESHRP